MFDLDLVEDREYFVWYASRDIGYGIEYGYGRFMYRGIEQFGKHVFEPLDGQFEPVNVYLFDDEIERIEEAS
jgi:hypothetical protein